jgi:hypothetical protein
MLRTMQRRSFALSTGAPIIGTHLTMKTHEFSIVATGLDPHAVDFEARLFDAGCNDATVAFQKGTIIVDFARDADGFEAAVKGALHDVEASGATAEQVEPDTLVSWADIAKRVGLSRTDIHGYAMRDKAEGFPEPVVQGSADAALYDWVAVSEWFHARGVVSEETCIQARIIREVNETLRRRRPASSKAEGWEGTAYGAGGRWYFAGPPPEK